MKIEIARSFAYKLNIGNYQTVDFFCSQKAEVEEKKAEKKSEELYAFCRKEVLKSINSYLSEKKVEPINMKKAVKMGKDWHKKQDELVIEGREDARREEDKKGH